MHILYVVPPAAGGIKKHVLQLIKHFKQKKHQVTLISPPDNSLYQNVSKEGGEYYSIFLSNKKVSFAKDILTIKSIINKTKPDLIHLHGYKAGVVGRLALLPSNNIPTIVTLHNFLTYPGASSPHIKLYQLLEKRILSLRTTKYIAVSNALEKDFSRRCKISEDKITVIYNGINLDDYEKAKPIQHIKNLGHPLIGTAVRLTSQKGIEELIEAAPLVLDKFPNGLILVAGEGPLKEQILQRLKLMNLENRVLLLGFYDNMPGFLTSLDVFVLPSRTEGLGIILLEALACGTPIIATQVGGVPEIISPGINGLLVPPQDPIGLAQGVISLINDYSQSKMAQKGTELIKENFLLQDMLANTEKIYSDVLQQRGFKK